MAHLNIREISAIAITFLVAMVLTILPLPHFAVWARPTWVFLVALFWMIVAPHRVGIGATWLVGLLVDLLTGSLLGQHAFVYCLIGYLVIRFHPQLKHFPLWQQTVMVFILVMLNLALQYWILGLLSAQPDNWTYWLPAFTSAALWPWLGLLLQEIQLKGQSS